MGTEMWALVAKISNFW